MVIGRICARVFFVPNQLPNERKPQATVVFRPGNTRPTTFELPQLPRSVKGAHGLASVRAALPGHVIVQPGSRLVAKSGVFYRELQVHPPLRSSCGDRIGIDSDCARPFGSVPITGQYKTD